MVTSVTEALKFTIYKHNLFYMNNDISTFNWTLHLLNRLGREQKQSSLLDEELSYTMKNEKSLDRFRAIEHKQKAFWQDGIFKKE